MDQPPARPVNGYVTMDISSGEDDLAYAVAFDLPGKTNGRLAIAAREMAMRIDAATLGRRNRGSAAQRITSASAG